MKNKLPMLVLMGLLPASLLAQDQGGGAAPELDTDRPTVSQSAQVVPRASFQLESGLQYQKTDKTGRKKLELLYPEVLLRAGLLEWAELRLETRYKREHELEARPGAAEIRPDETGLEGLSVGTKLRLNKGQGAIPEIGLLGQVTLPVGNKDLRPPRAAPEGRLLFSNKISEKLELQYNVGYRQEREEDAAALQGEAIYTFTGNLKLSDKVTWFGEFFGFKPKAGVPENSVDTGFLVKLRPNLQFDLIGGAGLSQQAPGLFLGTGLTWRIPE